MRILHIEDDPHWAKIIKHQLESLSPNVSIVRIVGLTDEHVAAVDKTAIDVCLLDLCLVGSQGVDSIHACVAAFPGVPVVVLSSLSSSEVIQECLQAGADAYWVKGTTGSESIYLALQNAFQRKIVKVENTEANAAKVELVHRLMAGLDFIGKALERVVEKGTENARVG